MLPDNILRRMSAEDRRTLGKAGLTVEEACDRAQARAEKELQRQVASYLNLKGVPYFAQRMDRKATGRPGTPDFIFCVRGRFCAAECKSQRGQVTEEQAAMLRAISKAGGAAVVARSLEDVADLIQAVKESERAKIKRLDTDESGL